MEGFVVKREVKISGEPVLSIAVLVINVSAPGEVAISFWAAEVVTSVVEVRVEVEMSSAVADAVMSV